MAFPLILLAAAATGITDTPCTPLPMPVLAIDADHSLNGFLQTQVPQYATNVTYAKIAGSGHWIYEEHPQEMTQRLLAFLQ